VPTAKGSGPPYSITYTHKISAPEYRSMITSVLDIVKKHDLVLQAQTDALSVARVRDKDFKYPAWRDRPDGYDPLKLREALLSTSSLMRPKRAVVGVNWPVGVVPAAVNGPSSKAGFTLPGPNSKPEDEPLPRPGKILDPAASAIEIIEKHMPADEDDGYIRGVMAMQGQVAQMHHAIASQIAQFEKSPGNEQAIKVYTGYAKLLDTIMQRGDHLMASHKEEMRTNTRISEILDKWEVPPS
jgi:hypothetical protein